MNLDTLRRRVIARFTILPEILYAVTRHWMILALCVGIGTAIMVAKVSTDPVMYEGKATLMLNSNESMIVEQDRRRDDRENAASFFASRVEILTSDTVLRRVILQIQATNILNQDMNLESNQYGYVRRKIQGFKDEVSGWLSYLEHPNVIDTGGELLIQKGINSFRRRLRVIPSAKTAAVELRLYGNNYDSIQKELETWIDSYKNRLSEVTNENTKAYFDSRMKFWKQRRDDAHKNLEEFKQNNPKVSQSSFEQLKKQLDRDEDWKDELERKRDLPAAARPLLSETLPKDPDYQSYLRLRSETEQKIISATAEFGPESQRVRDLTETLHQIDEKLRGFTQPELADPELFRRQQAEQIKSLSIKIVEERDAVAKMDGLCQELKALEDDFQQNKKVMQGYQTMVLEEADRMELGKSVQVQTTERPAVDRKPYNSYPHRQVLYGTVGGIVLGLGLALVLELLSNKVRFKNDVITEFGIPVVGVIPRK
jgi:uncharacterized protein involved in exopolysaccharide biosynthesis